MRLSPTSTATLLLATLLLASCEQQTGLSDLVDYELVERVNECIRVKDPSPGLGLACENVRKECERRNEQSIIDVCPFFP